MTPKPISHATHKYYRSVIVPAIAAHCGYESHAEAHRAIKAGFYGMIESDPRLPSMGDMDQETATRFLDYALRQAAEMSLVIPDPNTERSPSGFSRPPSGAVPGARE